MLKRKNTFAMSVSLSVKSLIILCVVLLAIGCDTAPNNSSPDASPTTTSEQRMVPPPTEPTDTAPVDDQPPEQPRQAEEQARPSAPGQPPAVPAQAPGGEIDDQQLDKFADALIAIQAEQQSVETQLGQADSPEEAQSIQQQAMMKMQKLVEESGISMMDYSRIASQLQEDPQLQQRLEQVLSTKGI